jgi:hypothetical protein
MILEEAVPDFERAWKRIDLLRLRLKRSGRKFGNSTDLIRKDRDR